MTKPNSEYRISALRKLPIGLLGTETYSIVAVTEVNSDLIKAEYFLLVQRPMVSLHRGCIELNMRNFPAELERWSISSALEAAQFQVEIELGNLLQKRATEIDRADLAYLPFEFKTTGASLMGQNTRELFKTQISEILSESESWKLKLYLSFLVQN